MKPHIFLIFLIVIIIAFGLIMPDGIRAAAANNAWSLAYIKEAAQAESLNPLNFDPPPSHRHAGMLLAHQALKKDNVDLAWAYLAPLVDAPDLLIRHAQANINFLQGGYVSAIHIWKELGHYSILYTASRRLNEDEQLDAEILALRSAHDLRGDTYDTLFTRSSMQKADLLLEENQNKQAIAIYRALIDEFPHHAWLYSGLARAYWLNNQPEQALTVIEQGWPVNAGNHRYYITAAYYYEELSLNDQALIAYQTALEINPEHHDALQGIERLTESDE